jgi:L-arabinose isomerase
MQLANDDFCSVPEFTGVAARFGKPVPQVILGHENDDPQAQAELAVWCDIAKVLHSLRKGRIGLMGRDKSRDRRPSGTQNRPGDCGLAAECLEAR